MLGRPSYAADAPCICNQWCSFAVVSAKVTCWLAALIKVIIIVRSLLLKPGPANKVMLLSKLKALHYHRDYHHLNVRFTMLARLRTVKSQNDQNYTVNDAQYFVDALVHDSRHRSNV